MSNRQPLCSSVDIHLANRMRIVAAVKRRNINDVIEEAFIRFLDRELKDVDAFVKTLPADVPQDMLDSLYK